jgi:co-chaperonin GroES (HSP10)
MMMTKKLKTDPFRHAESGIRPRPGLVLVMLDDIPLVTPGGIHRDPGHVERDLLTSTTGVVVMPGEGTLEEAGARVTFTRYAGEVVDGRDGRKYRVMRDADVWCDVEGVA